MGSVLTQNPATVSSADRVEPGSFPLHVASLPTGSSTPCSDPNGVAEAWVESFNKVLSNPDVAGISKLFLSDSYWRDQLCLSWDYHILAGPEKIVSFIKKSGNGSRIKSVSLDKSTTFRSPTATAIDPEGKMQILQAYLTVETDVGHGRGLMRLAQEDGEWKVLALLTFLTGLTGHEEATGTKRPSGGEHGLHPSRKNWLDHRNEEENFEGGEEPTVLILGEFQCTVPQAMI
jgi:hypothetical protein